MTLKMQELYKNREDAMKVLNTLDARTNYDEYKAKLDEVKQIDNAIALQEEAENLAKDTVVTDSAKTEPASDPKKFKNLAEQLNAIKNAALSKGRNVDPRLVKDEIKGANTLTDADGGYAIQSDFIGNIMDRAFERSELLRRVRSYPVSANSNRVNYVLPDDTEDATKEGVVVAGGIQAYWVGEGQTVPPTKPKFKPVEIKLSKIMGIGYATEESLEDIPFLAAYMEDSFSDAVAGLLTDGILNGKSEKGGSDGNTREPAGIFNSDALVTVDPVDPEKLSAKDFTAMKAGLRVKDWANAVWYMHPDLEEDLPWLTDDAGNPVYMPEGGISGQQYGTILGRPVVFDEFLASKGSKGDILLANMYEYMLLRKGEERKDWSIHVEFLTDQQCFRIIMRVNGAPFRNSTYSVRHSNKKRASFVTLAEHTTL